MIHNCHAALKRSLDGDFRDNLHWHSGFDFPPIHRHDHLHIERMQLRHLQNRFSLTASGVQKPFHDNTIDWAGNSQRLTISCASFSSSPPPALLHRLIHVLSAILRLVSASSRSNKGNAPFWNKLSFRSCSRLANAYRSCCRAIRASSIPSALRQFHTGDSTAHPSSPPHHLFDPVTAFEVYRIQYCHCAANIHRQIRCGDSFSSMTFSFPALNFAGIATPDMITTMKPITNFPHTFINPIHHLSRDSFCNCPLSYLINNQMLSKTPVT